MIFDKRNNIYYEVFDMHAHLGPWYNFSQPIITVENLKRSIQCSGIDFIFASHTLALSGETEKGNELANELSHEITNMFNYVSINPHYREDSIKQLDKWLGKGAFKGIKLHPETHRYRVLEKNCDFIFEVASQKRCPVLIHVMSSKGILDCLNIANRYPEVPVIMGHSGGFALRTEAVTIGKQANNIYFDLTASNMLEGNLEWMAQQVGAQRILFGTDVPFIDPKHCVGQVLYSDLSPQEKNMIFNSNAHKIMNDIVI